MTGVSIPGMDLSDPELLPQILEMEEEARRSVIRMARESSAVLAHHVLRHEQTNEPVSITDTQLEWHALMDSERRLLVWSHVEAGKGLTASTLIPTPSGWRRMGELRVGDMVFGGDGKACRVTFVTPLQHGMPCYQFTWDDGSTLIADNVHRWKTQTIDDAVRAQRGTQASSAHSGDGELCACGCGLRARVGKRFVHNHHRRREGAWRVADTTEILRAGLHRVGGDGPQHRWRMPANPSVSYAPRALPIDPYWLGAWLGDGDSRNAALTQHASDWEALRERLERVGAAKVRPDSRKPHVLRVSFAGLGLRARLRSLGVLGSKHVPTEYLQADEEQRLELLRGLLDTDGTLTAKGQAEFANMNERLAKDVLSLARSLGFKAHIRSKIVHSPIDGRDLGPCFTVSFMADRSVFHLPRKAARQVAPREKSRARYRALVSVEPVPSEPTLCIAVDSEDHTYLAGEDYVVTHNTQHFSIARVLWEIGHDPSVRCVVLTATSQLATKIARSVRTYIESSTSYREVFPHVLPSLPWTDSYFSVRRKGHMKDFTVQATGAQGKILGARVDRLFMDDVLNLDNTRTTESMLQMIKWYLSEFAGRLSKTAKVFAVGNAYNPHDLYHYLQRKSRYTARKYPVLLPNGEPRFPAEWSHERIAQKREELGPEEAARQLDCVPRDDSSTRCPQAWLDRALANGLDGFVYSASLLGKLPEGALIVSSMDLGVKAKKKSGKTSIATVLYLPPTPQAKHGTRWLLDLASGKWTAKEMLSRMRDVHLRYGSVIFVEDNAAQDLLVQIAQDEQDLSDLVVRPFNTGGNKSDPVYGVESIFGEFGKGMWALPSVIPPEAPDSAPVAASEAVAELVGECFFYTPTAHTGDHLMSVWINREGWRRLSGYGYQSNVTDVNVVGPSPAPDYEPGTADYEAAAQAEAERKRELEDWAPAMRRR